MRYFISPAERLRSASACVACVRPLHHREGEGRLAKERRGGVVQRVKRENSGVKRGRVVEKENEHEGRGEGEILYIIFPLANSNRGVHEGCGGEEGSETS